MQNVLNVKSSRKIINSIYSISFVIEINLIYVIQIFNLNNFWLRNQESKKDIMFKWL